MIDNRSQAISTSQLPVSAICDRKFGIGADGLIVIENHESLDFTMIYYNADGTQSFCGNGSRCAVAFAKTLGIVSASTNFLSTDGEHYAEINEDNEVRLKMHDVSHYEKRGNDFVIDTGSPHYIIFSDQLESKDIVTEARKIRYNNEFAQEGINVNFIRSTHSRLEIRTYERGVEDETLSCGTGVTAAALAQYLESGSDQAENRIAVQSQGGNLSVEFSHSDSGFHTIFLTGPTQKTFEGTIDLN